jgi:hypothetical protein
MTSRPFRIAAQACLGRADVPAPRCRVRAPHFGRATSRFAPGRTSAAHGFSPLSASFERQTLLFRESEYECAHCGQVLDLPVFADPQVVMRAAGAKPNVRVLIFNGVEIHRCDVVGLNPRPRLLAVRS